MTVSLYKRLGRCAGARQDILTLYNVLDPSKPECFRRRLKNIYIYTNLDKLLVYLQAATRARSTQEHTLKKTPLSLKR